MFTWTHLKRLASAQVRLAVVCSAAILVACGGGDDMAAADAENDARQQPLASSLLSKLLKARSLADAKACFYENANFTGRSFCAGLGSSIFASAMNNRVSAVVVPEGLRVDLFDGARFSGRTVSLTANSADLKSLDFEKLASSFRISLVTVPPAARLWSDPATWGGSKPVDGAAVVVPAGVNLVLDESTPDLGPVVIEGSLSFKDGVSAELRSSVILVRGTGTLRVGSADAPFLGRATITLTANDPTADPSGKSMGTRGILVYAGGKLELFGKPPAVAWTRLAAHGEAGATSLALSSVVDWQPGDQIVVAPTEWYPQVPWDLQTAHDAAMPTERLTLRSAGEGGIELEGGLQAFKWGALQYVTDQGMSLTPDTFTPPHPNAARVLDERAEVGNLSRNIVIQGADDALWQNSGFGAQVMVMDRMSSLKMDGVEMRRVGQAGKVGRYPLHWHLLSYNTNTGAFLGDAQGHFVRNSTVWQSRQRCMVIHGTNGVELRNNICYDIKGHAIFLEDGVERRNVIEGNLVLRVRSPDDKLLVAKHEERGSGGGCGGAASGYWITNPDNTLRKNSAADAQGHGFWLSYPAKPVKQGVKVRLSPMNLAHAPFEANTARANGMFGIALECAMTNDAGNTGVLKYAPTQTGSAFDYNNGLRFTLSDLTLAKNRGGGYLNRASMPDYLRFVVAGNLQRSITGAVDAGTFKQSLVVAQSLNNRMSAPVDVEPQLGIASYHSQMDIAQNTFVGFQNRGPVLKTNGTESASGTFGTDDYYIRPVEKGFWRNAQNRLIGSDPGYRVLAPHVQANATPATRNHWTLSGAIWDPQGLWGTPRNYWVLDSPFLREASCTAVRSLVPAGQVNGLSCAGPYYGVQDFYLNKGLAGATQRFSFQEKLDVTRLDASGTEVGRWTVEPGYTSTALGNMRHFAALKDDSYIVRFPLFPHAATKKTPPRWVQFQVDELLSASDQVLLGIHFDGTVVPGRVLASTNPDYPSFEARDTNSRLLLPALDKAAVQAGAGDLYWQDTVNHLVWIKATALGLSAPWAKEVPGSEPDLHRSYLIRIEPK